MTVTASRIEGNALERLCNPARQIRKFAGCCLVPHGAPPDCPDLAIYSQSEQFQEGAQPTWDSPDILTNTWNPLRLLPEASITVRNRSATASAVNAQVIVATASFGIGGTATQLGAKLVSLAPGEQQILLFPFSQALLNSADQRISLSVQIAHPYDRVLINNNGMQAISGGYTSAVGRTIVVNVPIVNATPLPRALSLSPLPNSLGAVVSPVTHLFAPMEQLVVELKLAVPSMVHGTASTPVRLDATLVARDQGGSLVGGTTYIVWVDN